MGGLLPETTDGRAPSQEFLIQEVWEICALPKFPGGADAPGPGTTVSKPLT